MKKIFALALMAAAGLWMTGCKEPIPAYQNQFDSPQITISDYWLRNDLRVTVPRPQRVGDGQLKVTIELYNTTDRDMSIDFKYYFVDENGHQVDNIDAGWEHKRLGARNSDQITFMSMSALAKDFRVQIRPGNRPG